MPECPDCPGRDHLAAVRREQAEEGRWDAGHYDEPGREQTDDPYRTFIVRVHREFAGGFLAGFGIATAAALLLAFIWWPR